MRISDLVLSQQEESDAKNRAKELNITRIILLLCSTFTLLLRYLFVNTIPDTYDPLWVRVTFSSLLLAIFILTYFDSLKKVMVFLTYSVFVLYALQGLILIQKNNFSILYILEFVILVIIICLAIKDRAHITIFLLVVFTAYAALCFIFMKSIVNVFVYVSLLAIFCGAILIFFDLKFETEAELRIREDLLNTIFNESPDALFLVDPSTAIIINCNDRALAMFEIGNQSEVVGNNPNYLLRYPYSPGAWKNLKKKVGQKRFLMQEVEFKTTRSNIFWGSQAITEINVGEELYWLVRITDITETVKDKKTIEENRKMLRQVVDLVPHAIFLKDNAGKFVLANKAVAEMYNTTAEFMVGKRDVELFDSSETRRFMEDDEEVVEKGKQKIIPEEFFTDNSGFTKILQTTKIPFYLDEEAKPGVLGIAIDITERVKDKQTIEENTKMLRQIIDLVPHQIYLKDSKGRFLLVNQAVADIHQIPKEDLIGMRDLDLYTSEEGRLVRRVEEDVVTKGRTRFIPEETFTDKDGVVRVMNTIKMPFYISDKREVGILGVNIDITEEKIAEKALRENESKYRSLMEQASDGIYVCDQEGRLLDANVKAAEMFGFSLEEFLSLNIKRLIDPRGIPDAFFRIPDSKDRQSIIVERRFLKKDGTPFTVELSAKLLDDGRHQAIIRDITERKKVEQLLKDNERKFRALIENSSDIIVILSEDFKLKYISPSVKRILGYDPERILDKFIFEFIHDDDIDNISKFLFEVLASPGESKILDEVKVWGGAEKYIFAEVVGNNMLKDPVINGIIINCHDITKRKNTEKELLNTNFELDSFVYKASHDLKAPLRSVMGLIRLAKLESKDQQQHLYLDMMNKSVHSLDQFIKDLTQFSRNSRLGIEARKIDFTEIINDSLGNLKFMENVDKVKVNKNFEFSTNFYSDLTRLSTIFNNLISNAYKYHRFENNNPYINITIKNDQEKAVIIVEDNGQGIDPLHVDRIFEMFYRASETSYGSGLGLYIVKNAVVKLNGTINVQSIINKGTKFVIEIPNLINKVEKNEG